MTFDQEWAQMLDVDTEKLIVSTARTMNDMVDVGTDLMKAGIDLIVVDSISALLPAIYFEKDSDGKISICFKFPFGFKETFDKEITECVRNRNTGTYDSETQARKISFFDVNPISVYEFAVKHHFEIDDSIMYAVAETETAWENIDHLTPTSTVVENSVIFGGKNEISHEFFAEHSTENISKNLFLSKTMGYPVSLGRAPTTVLEKIVTEKSNTFWLEEISDLLKIYKELECKICVIIDRTDVKQVWIKEFVSDAAALGITASKIKVCFRESSDQDQGSHRGPYKLYHRQKRKNHYPSQKGI
jgi:hypothetical protein